MFFIVLGIGSILVMHSSKTNKALENQHEQEKLGVLYQTVDGEYTMYQSELFDTYLIACALYFDFKSENLIMPENEFYQEVQTYFEPYKEHSFIQGLEGYVETQYQDTSDEVIQALIGYLYSNGIEQEGKLQENEISFVELGGFKTFINELRQFYIDSNAQEFFVSHQSYYSDFAELTQKETENTSVTELIVLMEEYVNTKETYFLDTEIHYSSFISLYRPSGGSFYSMVLDQGNYFVSYQSTFQERNNLDSMDIVSIIETSIHEYLHLYINPEVENRREFIEQLAVGQEKILYGGQLYQYMEWYRIVDENIVRAVETRIYGKYYNSLEKAFNQVLRKEIEWGEFSKVESLYSALDEYEANRSQYPDITAYTTKLIQVLFAF